MIEYEYMEEPEEIDTKKYEREIISGYRENTNTRPRRSNAGKGIERLKMNF